MTVDILQRSTLVLKNGGQNTIQYNKKTVPKLRKTNMRHTSALNKCHK